MMCAFLSLAFELISAYEIGSGLLELVLLFLYLWVNERACRGVQNFS